MFSKQIQNLIDRFMKFPGVGPKQAARFVFYLLKTESAEFAALTDSLERLRREIKICLQCYKIFDTTNSGAAAELCEICRDGSRSAGQILVVEKEVDLHRIERTNNYSGLYHVLGGIIDPLDSSSPARLHLKELFARVKFMLNKLGSLEVILATNPTADGEATALYIERMLEPLEHQSVDFKISRLGRGLSTGSELEYSDDVTISSALKNRK